MKPRTKIITTIIAMVLVVSAMVVGMMATSNQSLTVGNKLVFNPAKGVGATVYVRVQGHDERQSTKAKSTVYEPDEIIFRTDDEEGVGLELDMGDLHWKDIGTPIYIYIAITNNTPAQKLIIGLQNFTQPVSNALKYEFRDGIGFVGESNNLVETTKLYKGVDLDMISSSTPQGVSAHTGPDGGLAYGKTYVLEIACVLLAFSDDFNEPNNYIINLSVI